VIPEENRHEFDRLFLQWIGGFDPEDPDDAEPRLGLPWKWASCPCPAARCPEVDN